MNKIMQKVQKIVYIVYDTFKVTVNPFEENWEVPSVEILRYQ